MSPDMARSLRQASAGHPASFYVAMVDRSGAKATAGGDHLFAHLAGPAIVAANVSDLDNGTYRFDYVAWDAGEYSLEVMVSYLAQVGLKDAWDLRQSLHPRDVVYAHVSGSPFTVKVSSYLEPAQEAPARVGSEQQQQQQQQQVQVARDDAGVARRQATMQSGRAADGIR